MNFQEFDLSKEVKRAVSDAGYETPTEIQERTIPLIIEGHDVIGFSQTGSGKTAAFGLPAIDMIDSNVTRKKPQVLVICPTRELAMQGTDEIRKFSKFAQGVRAVSIYGGQHIEQQMQQLRRGCQIIIGTPGRIMDHMRRKTIKLDEIKMVVLDEADEMLNMGFRDDIETILSSTPADRQTVLFSATMPQSILDITDEYQKDAVMVEVKSTQRTVKTISQSYYAVARGHKKEALNLLIQRLAPELSVVFCNTKKMVAELTEYLEENNISAAGLQGDMKQRERTTVMNNFKHGKYKVLVATDVAARGIDVNDIDIVFNFDLPQDNEYYIHRIGRTGRAGKDGAAITFVTGRREQDAMRSIMKYIKCDVQKAELPLEMTDMSAEKRADRPHYKKSNGGKGYNAKNKGKGGYYSKKRDDDKKPYHSKNKSGKGYASKGNKSSSYKSKKKGNRPYQAYKNAEL